jgi:hypothetical protein
MLMRLVRSTDGIGVAGCRLDNVGIRHSKGAHVPQNEKPPISVLELPAAIDGYLKTAVSEEKNYSTLHHPDYLRMVKYIGLL